MSLNQLKPIERILFLQEFSQELIINSVRDETVRNIIEAEKIKRKFVQPIGTVSLERVGNSVVFKPEEFQRSITSEHQLEQESHTTHKVKLPKKIISPPSHALTHENLKIPIHPRIQQDKTPIKNTILQRSGIENPINTKPMQINPPAPSQDTSSNADSSMMKIDPLIKDKAVQLIECPGPGKNVLVKTRNKIKGTKITLNEAEIKNIVNYFASNAMIPIMGGILKAAVNNLIISAVVSDFVGSRFIITKQNPYSLIEGINQNTRY